MRISRTLLQQIVRAAQAKPSQASMSAMPMIDFYAQQYVPRSQTLYGMLEFGNGNGNGKNGTPEDSYKFLRSEIPVRLAHIMKELETLPPELLSMQSIKIVADWYEQSFKEVMEYIKRDYSENVIDEFTDSLDAIKRRHDNVVPTVAQGIQEMKQAELLQKGKLSTNEKLSVNDWLSEFLDRFFTSRISVRLLIHQHLTLFGPIEHRPSQSYVGTIDPHCDVLQVVEDAYQDARFLCDKNYMITPKLVTKCHNYHENGSPIEIVYIPSHLRHIMFELFKNAMRATVENHPDKDFDSMPPLQVTVFRGAKDVTIKLSDRGGGFSRSILSQCFSYTYTTATKCNPYDTQNQDSCVFAGYGFGLPISKLYARYLDGNLDLVPIEGHGLDAYVYLQSVPEDTKEVLPIFSKSLTNYRNGVNQRKSKWSSPRNN